MFNNCLFLVLGGHTTCENNVYGYTDAEFSVSG